MNKHVYIVHCVDTEGPLYESLEASFLRLKEIFGIELKPSQTVLKKLQNKELDLGGKEDLVADAFAPSRIDTLETWDSIDTVLDILLSDSFRNKYPDTDGNGWIYNWFCLNHVGFSGKNPRRRAAGYGNVFHHYMSKLIESDSFEKDLLQFHYHPLPFNGHYNYCGTAYVGSSNIFEILAHHIIDDEFFPAAYRAGMEAERPDSHWFLEQWIPFDYNNDSFSRKDEERQPDLRGGRYGDWRRSSRAWRPYHPSHDDYQISGNCHRLITRCVSLDSRVAKLEKEDVRDAFQQAEDGKDAILAFANHDFRDMRAEVDNAMRMIQEVSADFPDVAFHYSNAIDAMCKVEGIESPSPELRIEFEDGKDGTGRLNVCARNALFGSQPFLAIETKEGRYLWDNLDYGLEKNTWSYVFDDKTLGLDVINTVALAANSVAGKTEIIKYDLEHKEYYQRIIKAGHRELSRQECKL